MAAISLMTEQVDRQLVNLILAGFPLQGTANRVLTRASPDDWTVVAERAGHHGLSPLLYFSLKNSSRLPEIPTVVADRLKTAHFRTSVANMLAYHELARLLDALASDETPVILLKGSALAPQIYPDPGLRPFGDLDLLVPEARIAKVVTLLQARGYAPLPEMSSGFERKFSGQQAFSRGGPQPAQLDLHWHLFVIAYYRKRIPIDWFWHHTAQLEIDGETVCAFSPEAQLLHLCAHYTLHHHEERLVWLFDLASLVSKNREKLNWDEILEAINAFGLALPIQSALARMTNWWGVSIPSEITRKLEKLRPTPYERILYTLAAAGGSEARVVLDGLALPSMSARMGFWSRHMLPTPGYMLVRYRIRDRRMVPIYYLWRILSGSLKAIASLARTIQQVLTD